MFDNILNFFKKMMKKENQTSNSKDTAKERLHLVLLQDRANVSADFLDLMKQEIIEVIKKYIEVDESAIDVRLTNKENSDGTNGAPALYANIPIINIKDETRKLANKDEKNNQNETENKETEKEELDKNKENEEQNEIEKSSNENNDNKENTEIKEKEEDKTEIEKNQEEVEGKEEIENAEEIEIIGESESEENNDNEVNI
jgi:cell division topological specificity factor